MRFVLSVILARLPTPEDYGLIGMIVVVKTIEPGPIRIGQKVTRNFDKMGGRFHYEY